MGYRIGYSGPEVDELLQKAYIFSVVNNGWAKLESSNINPVDLDSLVTQGNYSISFWQNGPIQLTTNGPINVSVTKDSSNNKIYQTIYDAGKIYTRETSTTSFSNTWVEKQNNTDLDIGSSTPQNPIDNYIWIDTSGDEPVIKVYKEISGNWIPVSAADLAKASVYDPRGIKQPIDTYLSQKIADADLSKAEEDYNAHLIDGESSGNPIHVTTEEKAKWNAGISKDDATTVLDEFKTGMNSYADEKVNESAQTVGNISTRVDTVSNNIDTHIANSAIHITAEDANTFDNKAAGDHKHLNDGSVTVSAGNIVGLIPIERLDPSVLERNYTVTSYEEMMNLTTNEIQNGDSVYINSTKPSAWFVVDDTKLGEETYEVKEIIISDTSSDTSRDWHSVCYGNGKFVAVAWYNYFAYSTDGINWTEGKISSTSSRNWESVCYGNDKFVAVAYQSTYFAYSTDGITWTEGMISSTKRYWSSVCYGNDKFVAVASVNNNHFAYSTDGINWTESTISDTSRYWSSVCYGNSKFVAVANIDNNYFAYSTDGINWTETNSGLNSRNWYSVCYGNGKFVAVAYDTNYFAYSTDGITWTEGTIGEPIRDWKSVCYGNGKFVAVDTNSNYFAYSTDGITWTEGSTNETNDRNWESVCYGNGKFVAVAEPSSNYSTTITFTPTGLVQYAAPAKDLTWENITNKPSTLAEYNITDCYTKDEINALYNTIIENLNSIKTKATDLSNQITVDIPSDLDTTIETNTTTANELNNKLDILIKNASLDDALKNQILSLVENDMVGSMNVTMTRTINITYSWDIDSNGPGLSSTFKIPTGTSYTIDLNNPIEDIYTVDETYTSGMTDEHGDTGYYEFSGWNY